MGNDQSSIIEGYGLKFSFARNPANRIIDRIVRLESIYVKSNALASHCEADGLNATAKLIRDVADFSQSQIDKWMDVLKVQMLK